MLWYFQSLFTALCVVEICGFTGKVCNGGLARFVALRTMDELCPLCLKMGNNKRIKAIQINLEEAVWTCENEGCPWPFGYETPVFLPRKVGVKHSSEWEVYKKVQKRVGPIPISTELSLYTPPVTPSSDTTIKESIKSDFSGETNINEHMSQLGNILGCTDDSYAPKSNLREDHTVDENKIGTQALNAYVENQITNICAASQKPPIAQSIFDIDSNDLLSDEFKIEDSFSKLIKSDLQLALLKTPDIEDFQKPVPTVLEKFGNKVNSEDLKLKVKTEALDVGVERDSDVTKTMPQVKKISKANIDLHMIDRRRIMAVRRSVETEEKDGPKKIEEKVVERLKTKDSPIQIDSKDQKADVLTKQQTLENTQIVKHTTTITVDGSLPITLTYDLTDFEEKPAVRIPDVIKPIDENAMNNSQEEERKTSADLPVELVTKRIRPPIKRRAASTGKCYEKFSFGALKKCEKKRSIKDCDRSSDMIISSNKVEKLEEIEIVKDENCSIGALAELVDDGISRASSQPVEMVDLSNVDPTNLKTLGDDSIAENFNLSVLDDLLIDGYQNATANLNEEWLESFFSDLDT
ncbi:uncharacterized protein [Venturia canescens]|uniref:uncharacterized protein n=1 Tax=Venturia canescens TaxID=32260 RepID=UPI001C9D3D52|nr:uncharacterized protein LOC122414423 [Venturia canescens]